MIRRQLALEIKSVLRRDFPDVKLVSKNDPAPNLRVAFVYWLFNFIGFFYEDLRDRFFNNYFTVIDNYILIPRARDIDLDTQLTTSEYFILRHEIVHLRQKKKWGLWFEFSYIFLLPTLFTMRAYWEYEAYLESMRARRDVFNNISDDYIEFIVNQFSDPIYLFMFPVRPLVRAMLKRDRDRIMRGEL